MTEQPETLTDELVTRLRAARVLPVLRAPDPARALSLADRLIDAGIRTIELTTTIPDWARVLDDLRRRQPDIVAGMGTVRSEADAETAVDHGAAFLVSPGRATAVRTVARRVGVPLLEGGFTPSEVLAASDQGIAKLFPAHIGGVALLRDILTVAPEAQVVPTGGIPLSEVGVWLRAGALAVGVGGDLTRSDDLEGRLTRLREEG